MNDPVNSLAVGGRSREGTEERHLLEASRPQVEDRV